MHRTRPPDPSDVSAAEVEAARKSLREFDPNLDLWFDHKRWVWTVQEKTRAGFWSYVMTWSGPNGEYRGLASVDAIKRRLAEVDMSRPDVRAHLVHEFAAGESPERERQRRARQAENEYLKEHVIKDYLARGVGVRQTFGPGSPRSRKFHQGGDRAALAEAAQHLHDLYGSGK